MSNQTTHKKTYVPQVMYLTDAQKVRLLNKLVEDFQKGFFEKFSNTKETIWFIIGKLQDKINLSDFEIVTLKANDYIRDNKFRLPLWYYSTNL